MTTRLGRERFIKQLLNSPDDKRILRQIGVFLMVKVQSILDSSYLGHLPVNMATITHYVKFTSCSSKNIQSKQKPFHCVVENLADLTSHIARDKGPASYHFLKFSPIQIRGF